VEGKDQRVLVDYRCIDAFIIIIIIIIINDIYIAEIRKFSKCAISS